MDNSIETKRALVKTEEELIALKNNDVVDILRDRVILWML
jgi:hypothetical protein